MRSAPLCSLRPCQAGGYRSGSQDQPRGHLEVERRRAARDLAPLAEVAGHWPAACPCDRSSGHHAARASAAVAVEAVGVVGLNASWATSVQLPVLVLPDGAQQVQSLQVQVPLQGGSFPSL
mmetsp:Transcript_116023/g.205105  ORF Transcript_116023/g.205105 Transcript_116023/m.205105 type:complete len:121 (+) Transcript_116023:749-1111(+)